MTGVDDAVSAVAARNGWAAGRTGSGRAVV